MSHFFPELVVNRPTGAALDPRDEQGFETLLSVIPPDRPLDDRLDVAVGAVEALLAGLCLGERPGGLGQVDIRIEPVGTSRLQDNRRTGFRQRDPGRSFPRTLRLQKRSVLDFLVESVIAHRSGAPALALVMP